MPVDPKEVDLGRFSVESVDRIRITILKDGTAWTGIDSVDFVFEKPDRSTQFTRSATNEGSNVWYYDTTVTDFEETGDWTMNVRVTDGSIVKRYPYAIGFQVEDNP